jgi:import inner membrane translocase subunit TIM13
MDNVSSSLGFSASSDPKTAVMNQVRQEAAMTNARQLIEACLPFPFPDPHPILIS